MWSFQRIKSSNNSGQKATDCEMKRTPVFRHCFRHAANLQVNYIRSRACLGVAYSIFIHMKSSSWWHHRWSFYRANNSTCPAACSHNATSFRGSEPLRETCCYLNTELFERVSCRATLIRFYITSFSCCLPTG